MPVPESILKKRKRDEEWAAKRAADAAAKKDHRKQSRKDVFKRAEAYAAEYRTQVIGIISRGTSECETFPRVVGAT
jgi:large subunit ribosomal protein L7e